MVFVYLWFFVGEVGCGENVGGWVWVLVLEVFVLEVIIVVVGVVWVVI